MTAISNVLTGFRLFAGEKLNEIIAQVNNLTGNGTPGAVTGTTGAFSGAVNAASVSATSASTTNQSLGQGTLTELPTIVAAAGATQGTATALTKYLNIITCTASSQGVKLPTAATGVQVRVMIGGTKGVKVYPATADRISTAATNAAVALVADKSNLYVAQNASLWLVQKGA